MNATRKTVPVVRLPSPNKLAINCPIECSLHPSKIGQKNANILLTVRENGAGRPTFQRRATELLGYNVPGGNVQRHLLHYVELTSEEEAVAQGPKPGDIDILDSIIGAGYRNSRNWKPTIRDTLEAMKLKMQMTGNSAFDDLLSLFDSAEDPEPVAEEAPEAILSEEERPDEHDEDLEEPLAGE